jgi:glycosyltransferase involved in cell wall biosynthesis
VTILASDGSGARRPRIALFDWVGGGHHPVYVRRFAEALGDHADVVVAAPEETLALGDLSAEMIDLGRSRPALGAVSRLRRRSRAVFDEEVKLFERVVAHARPDHIIHLYADAVLPGLVRRPRVRTAVSLLVFTPRAHYPVAFQSPLSARERLRAQAKEGLIALWRRRRDAHALLTLDEEAARRWTQGTGAGAYWLPEPPVSSISAAAAQRERSGCILYGALSERKGIDLLAKAVALDRMPVHVTIAGEVRTDSWSILEGHIREMRRSGATVDVRTHPHTEEEGLRALSASRCAVLPYPRHDGMSRILVEAASVGTPVVVHDHGLLAHLVRTHRLGHVVDCRDPRALRTAVLDLAEQPVRVHDLAANLARFAGRYSRENFKRAVLAPFFGSSALTGGEASVGTRPAPTQRSARTRPQLF